MSVYQWALIGVGAATLLFILYTIIFKKDWRKYYAKIKPIITGLFSVIKTTSTIFPSKTLDTISTITQAAITATTLAESMWLDDEITKDERNNYAKGYITDVLDSAGIVVDAATQEIINGVIATVCKVLPHYETSEEQTNGESAE